MEKAVLLALAASLCTATASVCQRAGARCTGLAAGGFDARLIVRLARQPTWLLGIAAMIGGFVFQLTALHFGELGLVQPILAAELLFVFGYLAVAGSRQPNLRDWLAVAGMSAGIGVFLRLAALAVAFGLRGRRGASRSRRAAVLGSATGISWGFMAAVIKELSSHLGDGISALVTTWSLYLLLAAGAATMLLAAHALAAGPLAASQPGFTIVDPLAAGLLGVFLFGEHIRTDAAALVGEALALAVVIAGAAALSRSSLITGENAPPSRQHQPAPGCAATAARIGPPGPARGNQDLDREPAAA